MIIRAYATKEPSTKCKTKRDTFYKREFPNYILKVSDFHKLNKTMKKPRKTWICKEGGAVNK